MFREAIARLIPYLCVVCVAIFLTALFLYLDFPHATGVSIIALAIVVVGLSIFSIQLFRWRAFGNAKLSDNVVVLMPSSEGEFLLALSFLRCVAAQRSVKKVCAVIDYHYQGYLEDDPVLKNVELLWSPRTKDIAFTWWQRAWFRIVDTGALFVLLAERNFGLSVQMSGSFWSALAVRLAGIQERVSIVSKQLPAFDVALRSMLWTKKAYYSSDTNKIDFLRSLAENLNCKRTFEFLAKPILLSPRDAQLRVRSLLAYHNVYHECPWYICVAPGADSRSRRWSVEHYAKVIARLGSEAGIAIPILILLRAGEALLGAELRAAVNELEGPDLIVLDEADLDPQTFLAICSKSLLTVCSDGPTSHAARMTGSASVTLCGPTTYDYLKYRSDGFAFMIFPPIGHRCWKLHHLFNTVPRSRCVDLISDRHVYRRVVEVVNYEILVRKIDILIKDIEGNLAPDQTTLREKAQLCRDKLRAAVSKLETMRDNEDAIPELRLANGERLAYVHFLLGLNDETHASIARESFDWVSNFRKVKEVLPSRTEVWGNYPLAIRERAEGGLLSEFDVAKQTVATIELFERRLAPFGRISTTKFRGLLGRITGVETARASSDWLSELKSPLDHVSTSHIVTEQEEVRAQVNQDLSLVRSR